MRFALSALAAALLSTSAMAADVSGKLVVYTSQPNADAQQTVDAFQAKYPDVEVEWIRDGTTKIMAKLRAEFAADAPQPDVLLIADMVTMEGLEAEGRLMAYPEADTSAYDPALMDPEGHYFSTKLITTGIVYNTGAEMVPTSYADLLKPEAKDKLAMPSPLTSGAATIHMAAITSNPDLGWNFYEGLAAQGANPKGGNGGTYKAIAGGEKLYGFVVDFLPIRNKLAGAPVEFVFPEEGVSAVTEPAAILSTAKNPDAAKAFVDFLISEEGQQMASDMGYLPAHPGITPPEGFPALPDIKLLEFDPAKALAEDTESKMKFTEIFGG
ncbi:MULTISPECIES: ABC transporter substrate-binding protein [Rhodobacterales]|jgi:iron(III) transport system substrate-binding protein|uniref:ABC transporter substrate-binding protein n=1 Tax=Rhodobacterales TaxID=204455 RepID=UPI00237F21EC|nr:ABC transporter substrate-binding protein [Phaeobacter gallaeciensis]MDE4139943.1 ABC transporter substrate-binding protein [Phaeobacter gallaeciensis]MDE4148447.1 ABC transporter substrate-binding protein [Phaeobacter gallaeciensis]MDE4152608.1 ABC transporter substrate-binding protein [Phaeobacter gallaeciensis]MDE4228058.1 ABC transporter substrate-binding protein [Phaeobacter gallaeciensis]MDE4257072.1 ABC transporter substrate-binding protein [Phaeobacter gallaeciensis]